MDHYLNRSIIRYTKKLEVYFLFHNSLQQKGIQYYKKSFQIDIIGVLEDYIIPVILSNKMFDLVILEVTSFQLYLDYHQFLMGIFRVMSLLAACDYNFIKKNNYNNRIPTV